MPAEPNRYVRKRNEKIEQQMRQNGLDLSARRLESTSARARGDFSFRPGPLGSAPWMSMLPTQVLVVTAIDDTFLYKICVFQCLYAKP